MTVRPADAAIARPCGIKGCRRYRAAAPDCVGDDDGTRALDTWATLEPE